ncbi:MAG: ABC transporter permease [bacterium]
MNQSTVYDSAAAPSPLFGELRELWRYRELLLQLIVNSIKTRYKRSLLGLAWTMLNPLLHMAVLTAAFSTMFRGSLVHYPIYVLTGLLCWNFFSQTTTHSMGSLVWGGGLVKRIYIPRTIFVFSAVGNGLVNLGLSMIPLLAIMLLLGHPLRTVACFMPVSILLLTVFALGIALLMSVLAVFFADVIEVHQTAVQILFFLTPIMYPKNIFPLKYTWCLDINPMFYFVEIFRAPIYSGALPESRIILTAALFAIFSFALGWWAYTRKMNEFAYRL